MNIFEIIFVNFLKASECSEKDGWCTSNIQDKCRNLMSQKHEKLSKTISNEYKEMKKTKK